MARVHWPLLPPRSGGRKLRANTSRRRVRHARVLPPAQPFDMQLSIRLSPVTLAKGDAARDVTPIKKADLLIHKRGAGPLKQHTMRAAAIATSCAYRMPCVQDQVVEDAAIGQAHHTEWATVLVQPRADEGDNLLA